MNSKKLLLCILFVALLWGIALLDASAAEPEATSHFTKIRSLLHPALGNPIVALMLIVGLGLLLGRITVAGVSLGASGVIFVAIAFGAMHCEIPRTAGTFGLILFVYCIGITAGPNFFRAFVAQGADLAKLGAVIVVLGAATTSLFIWLADIPVDLAVGAFAGAMTSTPALAAAMDALNNTPTVSIGYGIAYPFGVIGVVLFVQVLPRLLRKNLDTEAQQSDSRVSKGCTVKRVLVEIMNPALAGKKVAESVLINNSRCQVPRVLVNERFVPITAETRFELGQCILLVGQDDRLPEVIEALGKQVQKTFNAGMETERRKVVVTSKNVVGKDLRELNLLHQFGVTISRIVRNDVTFVPHAETVIGRADILTVIGDPQGLEKFSSFAGHRARVLDETDLISLTFGVTAGILLGMLPIGIEGVGSFKLGSSGGPLLVGLLLGHFGKIGFVRGQIPRAARMLLSEVGLVFFLAGAGVKAGGRFFEVLQEQGPILLVAGAAITAIPMVVGYLLARKLFKLNLLESLGGVCGSMTSTPGLGAITNKTDSDIPVTSYATAYPVALILMTVCAQIIVSFFS